MDSSNFFYSGSNKTPAYTNQVYPESQSVSQGQVPQIAFLRNIMPIHPSLQNPNQLNPYSQEINQVYRWANWVKFIAIFIMFRAALSILALIIQVSLAHDGIQTDPFVSQLFILIFLLLIGYIGYRASVAKTSASAKFYIFCLLAYGVVELIWIIRYIDNFMDIFCEESLDINNNKTGHAVREGKKCNDSLYNTVLAISIGLFLFAYVCICTPIMFCICKMYSHANIVENQNLNRYQAGQHFHTFRFNPTIRT